MHRCPSTRQESIVEASASSAPREPWNKGKIVGQKAPFKVRDIWALRVRLQMENRRASLRFSISHRQQAAWMRSCQLKVRDICHGDQVATRGIVMQQKTQWPVQFEITPITRDAVGTWIKQAKLKSEDYLFPESNS